MSKPWILCCGLIPGKHDSLVKELSGHYNILSHDHAGSWPGTSSFNSIRSRLIRSVNESLSLQADEILILKKLLSTTDIPADDNTTSEQTIALVKKRWRQAQLTRKRLIHWHKKKKLKAVLVVDDFTTVSRALVLQANELDIPTCHLEHADTPAFKQPTSLKYPIPWVPRATHLFTFNTLSGRFFENVGPHEVHVVGRYLDDQQVTPRSKTDKSAFRIVYAASHNHATFASQLAFGDLSEAQFLDKFFHLISDLRQTFPQTSCEVIIKMHPVQTRKGHTDPTPFYTMMAQSHQIKNLIVSSDSLESWLHDCDLLVTHSFSSACHDAFRARVPCLTHLNRFEEAYVREEARHSPSLLSENDLQTIVPHDAPLWPTAKRLINEKLNGKHKAKCETLTRQHHMDESSVEEACRKLRDKLTEIINGSQPPSKSQ